jgi:hypothetical protein
VLADLEEFPEVLPPPLRVPPAVLPLPPA